MPEIVVVYMLVDVRVLVTDDVMLVVRVVLRVVLLVVGTVEVLVLV